MNPSEDTELVSVMQTSLEEKDLIPVMTHLINKRYRPGYLIELLIYIIPGEIGPVKYLAGYEEMSTEDRYEANKSFFEDVDELSGEDWVSFLERTNNGSIHTEELTDADVGGVN